MGERAEVSSHVPTQGPPSPARRHQTSAEGRPGWKKHPAPTPTKVSSKGPPQESTAVSRTRSPGWGSGSAEAPPPTMPASQLGPTRGWGWLSFVGGGAGHTCLAGVGGEGKAECREQGWGGGGLWPCLAAAWDLEGSPWASGWEHLGQPARAPPLKLQWNFTVSFPASNHQSPCPPTPINTPPDAVQNLCACKPPLLRPVPRAHLPTASEVRAPRGSEQTWGAQRPPDPRFPS